MNVTGSCVTSSTAYSQFGRSESMATIADVLAFVARVEAFLAGRYAPLAKPEGDRFGPHL